SGERVKGRPLPHREPASRRRLGNLSRGPAGDQRLGKSVLRAETFGYLGGRAVYAKGPGGDFAEGRRSRDQRLYEDCSDALRSVRLAWNPDNACRAHAHPV